jgi:hypothetical protein
VLLNPIRLALAFTLLIFPSIAQAQTAEPTATTLPTSPAGAVSGFVDAVMNKDYGTAWDLLSQPSKDYLIKAVADQSHLDPSDVASLFNATDPSVVRGFWTSFRNSFAPTGAQLTNGHFVHEVSNDGTTAVVQFDPFPGKWVCVLENGRWHVAYVESFINKTP